MKLANISAGAIRTEPRRGRKGRIRRGLVVGTSTIAVGVAIAQAQSNKVLARAQVIGTMDSCPVVLVNFQVPLNVADSSGSGRTLNILLTRIEPVAADTTQELQVEGGAPVEVPGLGPVAVTLDPNGAMPALRLDFASPVETQITQSGARSIVVALSAPGDPTGCFAPPETTAETDIQDEPSLETNAPQMSQDALAPVDIPPPGTVELTGQPEIAEGETPDDGAVPGEDLTQARGLIAEARAAITGEEYRVAIQLLTKLLALPENELSPDAQELLGVVRERNGQMAHAIAEYELYLDKYPDGEAAERVRQRLGAILTAQAAPPPTLREASGTTYAQASAAARSEERQIVSIPRAQDAFRPLGDQPGFNQTDQPDQEEDKFRAIATVDYIRNQSVTEFVELETGDTDEDEQVLENALVLGLDMSDEHRIGDNILSWRINGDYEFDLSDSTNDSVNLSRVYANLELGKGGPELRFGRQSRNEEGILGRFDGARASYPVNENFTVNAVLGLPVDSKSDPLFGGNRYVAGASVDYFGLGEDRELTGFIAGEFREGFVNRLAIGIEGIYTTERDSFFGLLDYDVTFAEVNIARLSWTRRFEDQSALTAAVDYRYSPLLSLSTALQGQDAIATDLTGLSGTYSVDEMRGLAQDRSSRIATATVSYQRPLNDLWQISVDGTVSYTGGNPASGGVPEVEAPGLETYASAQLTGNGILRENDVLNFGFRYANTATSNLFLFDSYWRYDVNDKLRLKPRLKVAHRDRSSDGGTEDFAIASLNVTYELDDTIDFDIEVGNRFGVTVDSTGIERSSEFFVFAGALKEF